MEKATGLTTQKRLLKWLAHTLLVVGLLTFSGPVSEFSIPGSQPAKTELSEARSVRHKKTVSLKAFLHSLSTQTNCTENFIYSLVDQNKKITVLFKTNLGKPTPKPANVFLVHHSPDYSKEHDSSQLTGWFFPFSQKSFLADTYYFYLHKSCRADGIKRWQMKKVKAGLRLLVMVLLLILAASGIGIAGNFLNNNRERYMDNEIKVERRDKEEDEAREDEERN